jgi:putative redox protein
MIDCETEKSNELAQVIRIGAHQLRVDASVESGGHGSAPNPHDLFDAALAACKAVTAGMYAKARGIPLERVETHVERDGSRERQGVYVLKVRVAFHGPMSDEQRQKLYEVVARCPIHKLMTTSDVQIETEPLA